MPIAVFRTLGDVKSANEREEYAYHVLHRSHDSHDEALLPGLFHLAQWYESTHNIFAARGLYRRAADVMIANGKGRTMEAIPAWEGIARTYRLERFPPIYIDPGDGIAYVDPNIPGSAYGAVSVNNFPAGENALQNIIQIYRDHGADTLVVAMALLDLADWHLLFEKTREAFPLYEVTWDVLSRIEGFAVEDFFSEPKLLHFPAPGAPRRMSQELAQTTAQGLVTLQFDINEKGEPRRLVTVDSQPQGMMDFKVRKSARVSKFRPAIIDGVPSYFGAFIFTHKFTYFPEVSVAKGDSAQ